MVAGFVGAPVVVVFCVVDVGWVEKRRVSVAAAAGGGVHEDFVLRWAAATPFARRPPRRCCRCCGDKRPEEPAAPTQHLRPEHSPQQRRRWRRPQAGRLLLLLAAAAVAAAPHAATAACMLMLLMLHSCCFCFDVTTATSQDSNGPCLWRTLPWVARDLLCLLLHLLLRSPPVAARKLLAGPAALWLLSCCTPLTIPKHRMLQPRCRGWNRQRTRATIARIAAATHTSHSASAPLR